MSSISTKFESHVGFSNGCAELTLKNPPPLVPSSLMTSCEATGRSIDCGTPWRTRKSPKTTEIGSSTNASDRHRST